MKKRFNIFWAVFLFIGIFSINAQDLLVLRDGSIIEAKVTEISTTEIRYKRFDHLDGPTIVVPVRDVLSIRYENGTVENFNAAPASGQANLPQEGNSATPVDLTTALQNILNSLPAIPIAGNNLKFDFSGQSWVARVNGENFSQGTIEYEETAEGYMLTLTQTHIWPGAVGKTAGNIVNRIPGGGTVGGVLNTAGDVAGALGPIETSGTIVLEYRAGPPASLRFVSSSGGASPDAIPETKTANVRNNWISFEVAAVVGLGIRYERMLSPNISLGVNIWGSWGVLGLFGYEERPSPFEINAFFRFYPAGKTFFMGIGLGINDFPTGYWSYDDSFKFTIIPEFGWKIDVGKPGGFYLMPCITVNIIPSVSGGVFRNDGLRYFYFGMGGAF